MHPGDEEARRRQEAEARLRVLLSALPDATALAARLLVHAPLPCAVFDAQGRFALANPAYRAMFGGEPPPEYDVRADPVAARAGIAEHLARAFGGEVVRTPVFWYDPLALTDLPLPPDLKPAAIALTCVPLPAPGGDGGVGHVAFLYEDVTDAVRARERAQSEQAQARLVLETTERRLRAITDNATLGLFLMDARQHCVFMNPAAERITGFTLAQVQGRPLHDFIHHQHPDGTPYPMQECPIDRALPTRNQEQGEDVFVHRDGHFYPVAFTASPLVEGGRPVGTVIELRDTTEEKRRDAERAALLADLERAVHVRDEFLSVASHELKTPLTPLQLRLDALERALELHPEGPLAERVRTYAATARKQLQRLGALVGDLLDVSRIAGGRLRLDPHATDLAEVAREVAARFEPEAARAGVQLVVEAPEPVVGHWDRPRLEQVVDNLVSNAVKYGAGQPVHVRARARDGRAELEVQDAGIGIAPEAHARIFGRFERAVSDRNYGGLGLGLYITRELLEAQGGSITVASAPGEGATFTVTLPLQEPRG